MKNNTTTIHLEVTMSNNKQSSVEWLISQLQKSKDWYRVLNEISQMSSARVDIVEQAKEMHKQEIIAAKDDGYNDAEQYYNETFVAQK